MPPGRHPSLARVLRCGLRIGLTVGLLLGAGPGSASARSNHEEVESSTRPVVLWFDSYRDVFEGTATLYFPGYHDATLDLVSRGGNYRCVGKSETHTVPPEADPPKLCDGTAGRARLTCSDGRGLTIDWANEDHCGRGYGSGYDDDGHALQIVFGGSEGRARVMAEDAVNRARALPPLPVAGTLGDGGGGSGLSVADGAVTTGTAFFVTWEGHLVTNLHVVRDASRVQVQIASGEFVEAEIVQLDTENDLALLHVEAIRRPLRVRAKSELARGQEVFTLGYPMIALQGEEQKATFGRVNSLTGMQGDRRFTQIDVPIQPGNSGGPLIDKRGEVVGVVTSMLHPRAAMDMAGVVPQNVNYALKSDYVHAILKRSLPGGWKSDDRGGKGGDYSDLVAAYADSVVLVRTW